MVPKNEDNLRTDKQRLKAQNQRLKQERVRLLELLATTEERLDATNKRLATVRGEVIGSQQAKKSFIVELWSRVFEVLGRLSLFEQIRSRIPTIRRSYIFVDAWVLGNFL